MTAPDAQLFRADPMEHFVALKQAQGWRVFDRVAGILDDIDRESMPADERGALAASVLSMLTDWFLDRVTVHRGDWLDAESEAIVWINGLSWIARLCGTGNESSDGEHALCALARDTDGKAFLDAILDPRDQRQQVDAIIELALRVALHLRSGGVDVDSSCEGKLATLSGDPGRIRFWPRELVSSEVQDEVVAQATGVAQRLPGCHGALLTGSLARGFKRDAYSDIDITFLCESRPDAVTHSTVADGLQPCRADPFGDHLFVALHGTSIHLEFATARAQESYFRALETEGRELPYVQHSCPDYAVSGYQWSTGRILTDQGGVLAAFRERAERYPDALRAALTRGCARDWHEARDAFLTARGRQNRVSALTALATSWESGLRCLAARLGVHVNPHTPKWIVVELANLPTDRWSPMPEGQEYLRSTPVATMDQRFSAVSALWDALLC